LEAAEGDEVCVCLWRDEDFSLKYVGKISMRRLTNSLLRKSPTSSVVDGPPMFMNTIAVGPLDDVMSCVTGGATVAIDRLCGA